MLEVAQKEPGEGVDSDRFVQLPARKQRGRSSQQQVRAEAIHGAAWGMFLARAAAAEAANSQGSRHSCRERGACAPRRAPRAQQKAC